MEKSLNAFRTISEVADELDVPKHVLRFWEGKFNQVRPMKRGGGRRYYRPEDVELLRGIRRLLYSDGYTIKGVQRILRTNGVGYVKKGSGEIPGEAKVEKKSTEREIPNLAGEAASAARRKPVARKPEAKPKGKASVSPVWTDKERVALGSVLQELEDCRDILRNLLSESSQRL